MRPGFMHIPVRASDLFLCVYIIAIIAIIIVYGRITLYTIITIENYAVLVLSIV